MVSVRAWITHLSEVPAVHTPITKELVWDKVSLPSVAASGTLLARDMPQTIKEVWVKGGRA